MAKKTKTSKEKKEKVEPAKEAASKPSKPSKSCCVGCGHEESMHYGSANRWCNTPGCPCQALKG